MLLQLEDRDVGHRLLLNEPAVCSLTQCRSQRVVAMRYTRRTQIGMNRLVVLLVFSTLCLGAVSDTDTSILPGLSLKNLVLYIAIAWIVMRGVLDVSGGGVLGRKHRHLPLYVAFVALIFVAALSIFVCVMFIEYPGYSTLAGLIAWKGFTVDHFLFMLVFLLGLRTAGEALWMHKVILTMIACLAALYLIDLHGILDLGIILRRKDGRLTAPLGDSNQISGLMALFVPMMLAAAFLARGKARYLWVAATALCIMVMLSTGSRGGIVALVGGAIISALLLRRRIAAGQVIKVVALLSIVGVVAFAVLPSEYKHLLFWRFVESSTTGNVADNTSGRLDIWLFGLSQMLDTPITLLSGFGWNTYALMNPWVSHNEYLDYYFTLGVAGLLLRLFIFFYVIRQVRLAIYMSAGETRTILMSFLIGFVGVLVAIFFVNFYGPWNFVWVMVGLMLRLVTETTSQSTTPARSPTLFATATAGARTSTVPQAARVRS